MGPYFVAEYGPPTLLAAPAELGMENRMSNLLQSFAYGDKPVRTMTIDGEIHFVAKDVCDVLGIAQAHRSMASLDDDEKGRHIVTTLGGPQEVATVNEAGLYSLVLRSRKPEAKQFKRWITHEVIPSIRKTGSYVMPGAQPPQTDPVILQILQTQSQLMVSMMGLVQDIRADLNGSRPKPITSAPKPVNEPKPFERPIVVSVLPSPEVESHDKSLRQQINNAVSDIVRLSDFDKHGAWSKVYEDYNQARNTNVGTMAANRKFATKIDYIESIGDLPMLYRVAYDLVKKYEVFHTQDKPFHYIASERARKQGQEPLL